jgi:hypothetical protein
VREKLARFWTDTSLVMTLIEVKPRKWGWCVFESPGVEPVFLEKDQAIGYAETRARLRTGEIRIFDSTGKVERVIAFDDANRRLWLRYGRLGQRFAYDETNPWELPVWWSAVRGRSSFPSSESLSLRSLP